MVCANALEFARAQLDAQHFENSDPKKHQLGNVKGLLLQHKSKSDK